MFREQRHRGGENLGSAPMAEYLSPAWFEAADRALTDDENLLVIAKKP